MNEWPEQDDEFPWNIAVKNLAGVCERIQTIDLLDRGIKDLLYLDEEKTPVKFYEW